LRRWKVLKDLEDLHLQPRRWCCNIKWYGYYLHSSCNLKGNPS
jgi:hypothetical protein